MSTKTTTDAFLDLELAVEVWLGTETVPLKRLLRLEPGGVLPLSHDPDGPVQLVANGAVIASGELVVVDGKFGFRVIDSAGRSMNDLAGATRPSATDIGGSVNVDAPESGASDPAVTETVEQGQGKEASS
jgi:flagellar motor switch protein FliN